jgi:hypothetical protein
MKFRKKPVVIEAVQWTGENAAELNAFMGGALALHPIHTCSPVIHTLEGDHLATRGDWIIKGVKGEFYPCKPDIFAATYEEVSE